MRPFWTPDTGQAVQRSQFTLLWVRGRSADGPRIWEVLRDQAGFFGLVYEGKDLAVRVSSEADVSALQVQLRFAMQDEKAQFKQAAAGQRWWRLGPLTDAEVWSAKELVRRVGLDPLRGEIRFGKAGPFRTYAFFAATGEPSRRTLDDGSWMASEAQLTPAGPPPRKPAGGSALSSQSVWGGARQQPAPVVKTVQPTQSDPRPALAGVQAKSWQPTQPQQKKKVQPVGQSVGSQPVSSQAGFGFPHGVQQEPLVRSGGDSHQKSKRERGLASVDERLDRLLAQVEELTRSNGAMAAELRALRQENADIRQQLGAARGVQVHQPYAIAGPLTMPMALVPSSSDGDVLMAVAEADRAGVPGALSSNV